MTAETLTRPTPITVMPFLGKPLPALAPEEALRWAIYARVSKKNRKGETISVDRQVEVCLAIVAKKDGGEAARYLDRAKSASRYGKKPRPRFERLLGDMEAGLINAVAFWDVDRLIRQPEDLERFMRIADDNGVHLEVHTGIYNPSIAGDRLMLRMKGIIAAFETDHRSERIVLALKDLAEEGSSHGGRRPFGFAAPHYIEHVPEEIAVIREAVERVLEGTSLSALARDFNVRGIPSAGQGKWSSVSLRNCLISPRIAGYRVHIPQKERDRLARMGKGPALTDPDFDRREMHKAQWEGAVDLDTWRRVRRILVDPSRGRSGMNTPQYPLSGIIRCHNCHANLVPKASKGRSPRYVCVARLRAGLAKAHDADLETCGGRGIRMDLADTFVASRFLAYLSIPDNFAKIRAIQSGTAASVVDELSAAIANDERQLAELADMMASGAMPVSVGAATAQKIQARIDKAQGALSRTRPPDTDIPTFQAFADLANWWNDESVRLTTKRSFMRLFVSHVDLLEAGDRRLDTGRLLIRFHDQKEN